MLERLNSNQQYVKVITMNKEIFNNNTKWMVKTYNNLVQSRLYRGRIKRKGDGYNKHHIIPKCLGGKDEKDNYVLFTFREHIIAHMLLSRIHPDSLELKYALLRMIQSSHSERKENTYRVKDGKKIPFNTRYLENLRNESVEYLRFINLGTKASEETKEKLSSSHLGLKYSEEHKKNLSEMRKGVSKANIKVIDPNGNVYKSISECCRILNINRSAVTEENGFKIERKPTVQNKKIKGPDGTIYNNLTDCSKKTGYYKTTISRWIKNNPNKGFSLI